MRVKLLLTTDPCFSAYVVHAKGLKTDAEKQKFAKEVQRWIETRVAKHKYLRGGECFKLGMNTRCTKLNHVLQVALSLMRYLTALVAGLLVGPIYLLPGYLRCAFRPIINLRIKPIQPAPIPSHLSR